VPPLASATFEIAKREFMENVLSRRFLLALVLSSLILVTSMAALSAAYNEDYDAYRAQQDTYARQDSSFSRVLGEVHRILARPNVLSIFVGGPGDEYRSDMASGGGGGPVFGSQFQPQGGSASPTNKRFDPLDLGFVAVVVMTFLVVMFSYDAISGEKERGTLKLMLANPIPKDAVLLGKYLGGMASVLLPFALSVVLGLAVLAFMGVTLAAGAWVRLGVILALLVLLLSAFYLIGLLVSSLSRRSATALLVMTLVWLVLVFGVGNAAAVVAKTTTPAPTSAELAEQYRSIDDRAFTVWEDLQAEMQPLMQRSFTGQPLTADEQARLTELQKQSQAAFEQAEKEREAVRKDAMRRLDSQLFRAESFAAISPAEAFRTLATSIARSDYWSFRSAIDAAETYQEEVDRLRAEWLSEQVGAGSARATIMIGGPGGVRSFGEEGFEPPSFTYATPGLPEQVGSAAGVRDLLVLLAYNLFGFIGAYVAFLRYDVR